MLDLGVQHNIIEKSGSWFSCGDERIGQGRDAARQFLRDNPSVATRIEQTVRAKLFPALNAANNNAAPADAAAAAVSGDEGSKAKKSKTA